MTLMRYLIGINVLTFALRGLDKFKAILGGRRISEKQLLTLVALGGVFGALIGMKTFRHKTMKGSFLWKLYLVMGGWIGIILLYQYNPELLQNILGS